MVKVLVLRLYDSQPMKRYFSNPTPGGEICGKAFELLGKTHED